MNLFKKIADHVLHQNYTVCMKFRYRRFLRNLHGNPPLIIFQMGKVGSTSVQESLKACNLTYELFHVHVLTHKWIQKVHNQYREASHVHGRVRIPQHLLESMYLRSLLDRDFNSMEWKIISMVRDPVARNISTFFQAFPIYFPALNKKHEEAGLAPGSRLPDLLTAFEDRFEEHDTPLTWFETHLEPVFGVDVYQTPFPKDRGYQIIRKGNVSILLMRLEDLEKAAKKGLKEFIEIDNFVLQSRNISEKKSYANIFKTFLKHFRPSINYLNRMYNSRYMQHFYSSKEIGRFREHWTRW